MASHETITGRSNCIHAKTEFPIQRLAASGPRPRPPTFFFRLVSFWQFSFFFFLVFYSFFYLSGFSFSIFFAFLFSKFEHILNWRNFQIRAIFFFGFGIIRTQKLFKILDCYLQSFASTNVEQKLFASTNLEQILNFCLVFKSFPVLVFWVFMFGFPFSV
jgi:hypothetical protein